MRTAYSVPPRVSHLPEAPRRHPGMTWAELARAEGHRKGLPASEQRPRSPAAGFKAANRARVKQGQQTQEAVLELLRTGQFNAVEIAAKLGITRGAAKEVVTRLRLKGYEIQARREGNRSWYDLEAEA